VALIFLYNCCKFGEKICNSSRDIDFFLGDYFFGAPCTLRYLSETGIRSWAYRVYKITLPLSVLLLVMIVLRDSVILMYFWYRFTG